jgi:sugar-specific transcriptional regulator TrmB
MNKPLRRMLDKGMCDKLSLELALKALKSLGLKELDAQVYVYLAKKGTHGEKDLANALKLTKQQLYCSLESLKAKGMVSVTIEHPVRFCAISLEKVLDLLMKTMMEQAKALQANKEELLYTWHSMIEQDSANS